MSGSIPLEHDGAVVGIGVVGIGFGQHVHVPAFRADPRCRIAAICASSIERAGAVATSLGIPQAYGDWRALVADPAVRIVTVAVPPLIQEDIVIAAARHGKSVFCEKPAAINAERAAAMLAATSSAGVPHAVDFLFPEIAAWQEAKAIVESGVLGELRRVFVTWHVETYAVRRGLKSWKSQRADGGGTLNSFVSHTVYYLEWLLGPIASVDARLLPGADSDVSVYASLDFASGLSAALSVASDTFLGNGHRVEIHGSDGALLLENRTTDYVHGFTLGVGTRAGGTLAPVSVAADDQSTDGRVAAASRVARRLVDSTLDPRHAPVTPNLSHALRVQRLLDAMRASSDRRAACVVDV